MVTSPASGDSAIKKEIGSDSSFSVDAKGSPLQSELSSNMRIQIEAIHKA